LVLRIAKKIMNKLYMKTTSTNFYALFKAFAFLVVLGFGTAHAQTAFKGGSTYWIDGVGNDLEAPKDTFANLMGTYTGGAYSNTTGIFRALTVNGVDPSTTGQITFLMVDGYSGIETALISLGDASVGGYNFMSQNRPVVLKSVAGSNDTITTSVSVSANNSMFTLYGVQYFTIDGEATTGERNLTFLMPSGSTSNLSRLLHLNGIGQNGCQSVTIKNCIITGRSTTTAVTTFSGVYLGGYATTPSNESKRSQNITIENNIIQAVQFGVYARGVGGAINSHDYNLQVLNNQIGGMTAPGGASPTTFIGGSSFAAGIYLSAQANAVVSGNVIKNSIVGTSASFGNFQGIALTNDAGSLSLDSNCTINGNRIYNHSNTSTSNTGTYGIRVTLGTHNFPLNNTFSNNAIGNITSSNAGNSMANYNGPIGILVVDNTNNAGYNFYHNTISLGGDTLPNGGVSACIVLGGNVTGGVKVINNLLVNNMGRNSFAAGVPATNFGLISLSVGASPITEMSGNAFHVNNFRGSNSYLGYFNNKVRSSLREMNEVFNGTSNSGTIPPFMGVNDSTMFIGNGTASQLGSAGVSLAAVSTDINGVVRNASAPSVGAYEFTPDLTNANYGLWGGNVYEINGVNAWPVGGAGGAGSFASVADAITYLNNYGVTGAGNVYLTVNTGYMKESKFVPAITEYPGTNPARHVILGIASGYSDTLTTPNVPYSNHFSVLRIIGASNFTVDGRSKKLTIMVATAGNNNNTKVVTVAASDTTAVNNVTIKNCILTGQSTTTAINTYAGVYSGYHTPSGATPSSSSGIGSNNNITIEANLIQAVRNGIYVRGANIVGKQNLNWDISDNIIGGTTANGGSEPTTYIGGNSNVADDQGGITLKGVAQSMVEGNTIKNTIPVAASSGFKGIDLTTLNDNNGKDSAITISGNMIYNLSAGTVGNNVTYGIKVNLGNDSLRAISIINNSIAKIRGTGSGSNNSTANPMGIFIDAPTVVNNLGLTIYFNSIQMSGNVLLNGSSSSCILLNTSIAGGVSIHGNILSNTMGRVSGSGNIYSVFIGSGLPAGSGPLRAPNGSSNFNAYFAGATGSNGFIGCSSNGALGYNSLSAWKTYTAQDVGSYFIPPAFMNDSLPDIDPSLSGAIANGAASLPSVTEDIYGTARGATLTNIGAVQFTQSYSPLAGGGTYMINGVQNPPTQASPLTGSFATVNRAFQYINANGVDNFAAPVNPIKLVISAGYVGEGDTLIAPLLDYPRMNPLRPITLTTDAGRNDTITSIGVIGANGSVLRFAGANYFTLDGSNNGSTSRNITIMLPASATNATSKVVDITAQNVTTSNLTIKNCNIVGNSTVSGINTFAGIYQGGVVSTPSNITLSGNNFNTYQNNYIVGVRNGIYVQGLSAATTGVANQQDLNLTIKSNVIGGNNNIGGATPTDFWGGANNSAGILVSAQSGAVIDGNTITNSLKGFSGARGIELSNVSGNLSADTNITVSNNIISKIENTTAAGSAYGIYISLGASNTRAISLINNMISGIAGPGTSGSPNVSMNNPYGILVDGTGTVLNLGLSLYNNSINLGLGANLTVTNSTSACLFIAPAIRGGINSVNNIYQNTLGRPTGTGNAYAVLIGANQNVFTVSDNNNYFVNAANSNNFVMARNASSSPITYRTVDTLSNLTNMDTMSISFVTPFTNDSNLLIPSATQSNIFGSGKVLTQVPNDILGNPRSISQTVLGAHEYLGSYIDSVAPKAFNVTAVQACSNGPFNITMRVIERNVAFDTLFYAVNGINQTPLTGPTVDGLNRTFQIPSQAPNSSITYRYSVYDGSAFAFSAKNPTDGGVSYLSTISSVYPLSYGFDGPNTQGWNVEQVSGAGGWDLDSYGSGNLPILGAQTGNKAALFPAATLPGGTTSRLVSPCLDLSVLKVPTLRFWISQNADAPTSRDSIVVKVSALPGVWSAPLKIVYRVNTSYAFPAYTMVDVCLSNYTGIVGLKVALEASAKGNGNNMVLDSIIIFDDVLTTSVTPLISEVCLYDSVSLNITTTKVGYNYQFVNTLNGGQNYGPAKAGTGSAVNIKALNQGADSIYLQLKYTNTNSGCINVMDDVEKVYIKKFHSGPFMVKGTPFTANYNQGTQSQPDAAKSGDVITYEFKAPSGLANTDYGTKWTITNQSVKTNLGNNISSSAYTAPAGSTNGFYTLSPSQSDEDSLFKLTITVRLLPSGCDSTITRWVKVTSAPVVNFLVGGGNTVCANANVSLTNLSTYSNTTAPVTMLWEFGDGSTATSTNTTHKYDTAGTYDIKLTVTNNIGIAASKTITVTVKDAPSPGFDFGNICAGSPTTLTNTSLRADGYAWDFILGVTSEGTSSSMDPTYSFGVGDTAYSVKLTATNSVTGCSNVMIKTIYSFPKPTAAFTTTGHCLGTNVALTNNSVVNTAKPNSSFGSEWEFGNGQKGLSNQPFYIYPASGTYSIKLKVTTNFGCKDSVTNLITVFDRPKPEFTVSNTCQYDVVNISNATTFSGGMSKVTFKWNFGDNTSSDLANPTKIYGVTGNVAIKLVVQDTINFCKDSLIRYAEVFTKPIANFVADVSKGCEGQLISFTNASTVEANQDSIYFWDYNDGNTETLNAKTNTTHTYTTSNAFNIMLIVTTKNKCMDSATKTVNISSSPVVSFTYAADNSEDSCRNNFTRFFTPSPTTLNSYSWDFGDGSTTNGSGATVKNLYNYKGKYYVKLVAKDINGCTGTFTDSVETFCSVGVGSTLAEQFGLNISPNPFSHSTFINYTLPTSSNVDIHVFDLLGRTVANYDLGKENAGSHRFTLDADKFNASSGTYMVKIVIDGNVITQKIIQTK
jgi:PKD repeat protein